jgi:hypothetical protein
MYIEKIQYLSSTPQVPKMTTISTIQEQKVLVIDVE